MSINFLRPMPSNHLSCKRCYHLVCINFQYRALRYYDDRSLVLIRSVMALPTLDLSMSFIWKQVSSWPAHKLIVIEFAHNLEFFCGQIEHN